MQTFIWGEEFYTGLGVVDEQHHALVDLFNALSECLEASIEVGETKVQLAFSELMARVNALARRCGQQAPYDVSFADEPAAGTTP